MAGGGEVGLCISGLSGSCVNNCFFGSGLLFGGVDFRGAGWLGMRRCLFNDLLGSFVNIYFFENSVGANSGQAVDGPVVLTLATGLQAVDDFERAAVIDQRSECERDHGGRVFVGQGGFQAADFAVEY
jgi:hypothetical protein